MENQESEFRRLEPDVHDGRIYQRINPSAIAVLEEGVEVSANNNLFGIPAMGPGTYTIQPSTPLTAESIQRVIDDIHGRPRPMPMPPQAEIDQTLTQVQSMPAATIQAIPPVPTTLEHLTLFFESFHGRTANEQDLLFIQSLPLTDKIYSKEMIANYQVPVVESEDDLIDLPHNTEEGNSPVVQSLINQINDYENQISSLRNQLRLEYESVQLPSFSLAKIKDDFSDFWDASITNNMELELKSKYDCKLSHSFKEKPDAPERTILVNLGKYRFNFKLSSLRFIQARPLGWSMRGSITHPHPHISSYICWGSQAEAVQDVIIRKDFKAFSRMLFQAITNYNHASTFCSLLKYKIHLGNYDGETTVMRAGTSYRTIRLTDLPKGINLSSVSSCNNTDAHILVYRRYMPYLNDYLAGNYFKVSKSIDPSGFIKDERSLETNEPVYQTVDDAEIARIILKRGPQESSELDF